MKATRAVLVVLVAWSLAAACVLDGCGQTPTLPTQTDLDGATQLRWGQGSGLCDDGIRCSLVVRVYEPESITDTHLVGDAPANRLVAVLVEIDNTGPYRNPFDILPSLWFYLMDSEGLIHVCRSNALQSELELAEQTLVGGETAQGYVVFEIPATATPVLVVCAPLAADTWWTWSD